MAKKPMRQLLAGDKLHPFYSKQLMQNVFNGENGENLYAYLSQFNHINVGYVADKISARNAIPDIMRKNGLYITYYINNKPTTEIFVGDKVQAGTKSEWIKDELWEFHDGIGSVEKHSITLEDLSQEVINLLAQGNNTITNQSDGEDLTQVNISTELDKPLNVLKFANKVYSKANFTGLGRTYLRKNIVDNNNILIQDMINEENTRYIIQYAYDLNGTTINIPTNVVLEFQGGSFTNGTINCDDTIIMTYDKDWINVTIQGSYFFFGWNDDIQQIEIANNLTTNEPSKALSAAQGVELKKLIDNIRPTEKPVKPVLGQLWYDTDSNVLTYWNGSKWISLNEFVGKNVNAEVTDVESVESTKEAEATVSIENNIFKFGFKIPKGAKGDTGEQGEKGETGDIGPEGPQGPPGIPGVSFEIRYCRGNKNKPQFHVNNVDYEQYWPKNISDLELNEKYPYIWCCQGSKVYLDNTGAKYTINWSTPFRLSRTNGIDGIGADGKKGQIIYPAGIYDVNTAYITDENKAPYVLDNTDGNYYVLNAIMSWKGTEHDNLTPSQDYAINSGKYWLKFDGFNAIFAKIGIIVNGLIGSAVFNGDWMFSQQGLNDSGSFSTDYQTFDGDPLNGAFRPNFAVNFKTGQSYQNNVIVRNDYKIQPINIDVATLPTDGRPTGYYLDIANYPNGGFIVLNCANINNGIITIKLRDDSSYIGVSYKIAFLNTTNTGDPDTSDPVVLEAIYTNTHNDNAMIFCNDDYYTTTAGTHKNTIFDRRHIRFGINSGLYEFIGTNTVDEQTYCSWIVKN